MNRNTFQFLLETVRPSLTKRTTNAKPNPTTVDRQLASTLYRYAHTSFITIRHLFGISKELASTIFHKTSRAIVYFLYDEYTKLPYAENEEEWEAQLIGCLENDGFPCAAAWDGFHVYVATRLESFYSFKKRYTITNMVLISFNKRFLYAAVGAHDARILKNCSLYNKIIEGPISPQKAVNLGNFGEIPYVAIGDSAFPKHSWLIKAYDEKTADMQEKYFNKYFCKARVVTENAYGWDAQRKMVSVT